MPIIPLIGISIIVHLGVILVVNLFRITPFSRVTRAKRRRLRRRPSAAFGKLIIVIIFGFSLVSAAWMVRLSVLDRHSTVAFIGYRFKYYNPFNGEDYHPFIDVAGADNSPPPGEIIRQGGGTDSAISN